MSRQERTLARKEGIIREVVFRVDPLPAPRLRRAHKVTPLHNQTNQPTQPIMQSPFPMISVADARSIVMTHTRRLPPVQHAVDTTLLGRVLAEDVTAPDALPPFRASTMDGYAVVAGDGVGEYPIVADVTAGMAPDFQLKSGEVCYITTGAPLPAGADAVVQVEKTSDVLFGGIAGAGGAGGDDDGGGVDETRVRIDAAVGVGTAVRPIGCDIAQGATVLSKNQQITAAEIGLLAAVGRTAVNVGGTPRVGVLSTGDELVEASTSPLPVGSASVLVSVHLRSLILKRTQIIRSICNFTHYSLVKSGTATDRCCWRWSPPRASPTASVSATPFLSLFVLFCSLILLLSTTRFAFVPSKLQRYTHHVCYIPHDRGATMLALV
jgi:hypothetical protein